MYLLNICAANTYLYILHIYISCWVHFYCLCVYMVLGVTTLHPTSNKMSHTWERPILLLPASIVACSFLGDITRHSSSKIRAEKHPESSPTCFQYVIYHTYLAFCIILEIWWLVYLSQVGHHISSFWGITKWTNDTNRANPFLILLMQV